MADVPARPAEPGGAPWSPAEPGLAAQAEPIPTTNPHAQVTKMAFAWSKDQTPSNYRIAELYMPIHSGTIF